MVIIVVTVAVTVMMGFAEMAVSGRALVGGEA